MKYFSNFIQDHDIFGEPISMRYKGKTQYQTIPGGICTLLTTIVVAYYTIEQMIQLVEKSDPTMVRNTIYHSSEEFGT